MWRRRLRFPDLMKLVQKLAAELKPDYVLVEDAASGQSLIQELKHRTNLPIVPVKPEGDKVARAAAVTAEFEAGRVFLPKGVWWVEDFEYELQTFPNGQHDDIVDSTVQYLTWARTKRKRGARIGRAIALDMRPGGSFRSPVGERIIRDWLR